MSVGLPGRGNDIGHVGAVQQRGAGEGELPVTVVDVVHDPVQAVEAVFLVAEQLSLALFRARVERSHLHLENAFAAPVFVHDALAQFDDWPAVAGRESRLQLVAAHPPVLAAQPDEILLGGQGMLPQTEPQFLGHVDQVHVDDVLVGRIGRHDFAVSQALGRVDFCLDRRRVFPPAHLPDAPARVAEALAEHADRQSCDVAAGEGAAFGQESGNPLVDAAEFHHRDVLQPVTGLPGRDDGQAVRLFLFSCELGRGLVPAQSHRAGQAGDIPDHRLDHLSHRLRGFVPVGLAARDIEKGFVHRKYLHVRRDIQQGVHDAGGDLRITLGTGGHLDEFGAQFPGLFQPHGGVDAERPGLVGTGDETGAGLAVGDADGFTAVFGVVQLFDGGEEGVHVHEGDEARPVVVGARHGTIDPSRVNTRRSRGGFKSALVSGKQVLGKGKAVTG